MARRVLTVLEIPFFPFILLAAIIVGAFLGAYVMAKHVWDDYMGRLKRLLEE